MRKPLAIMLTLSALLSACGGGGGGGNADPAPVQSEQPAASAKVTLVTTHSVNPSDPASVVVSDSGTTASYYADASGALTETLLRTANGTSSRAFYNADGSISRIVDESTGNTLFVAERTDKPGANYMAFDAGGQFIAGQSVYRDNGTWYTAPLQGTIGQVVGALGAPLSASFALKADSMVYGAPTVVDASLQTILSDETTTSLATTALDFFLPAAYAQSVPPGAYALLARAAALSVAGGLIYTTAPVIGTALLIGGAVSLYQGLTETHRSLLDQLDLSMDAVFRDRLTVDLDNNVDPLDSVRASVSMAASSGFDALRSIVAPALRSASGSIASLVVTPALADTHPPIGELPELNAGNVTLSGTFVDSSSTVYPARGTIDANGNITVQATSPSGMTVTVAGQTNLADNSVTGQYRASDASGQTLATGTVAQGAVALLGDCQTTSQSGGLGTFAYAYNLGASSGTFSLDYDMYTIPDAMTVVVGGAVVFSTNGLVAGANAQSVPFNGGDTAFINVSAPNQGTQWTFTLGCAQ